MNSSSDIVTTCQSSVRGSESGARTGTSAINLQPGYQKLDGGQALSYVRFRHFDSDIYRLSASAAGDASGCRAGSARRPEPGGRTGPAGRAG